MDGDRVRLPANIDVDHARLPANYEAAKKALAACAKVDECKDWYDKAAALASYGRQLNDQILIAHAQRIKARAIYRCGEVLDEIKPSPGRQPESGQAPTRFTRTQAAKDAGLSPIQRKNALRVSNIPKEQFDELVDSDTPPTISELAALGTNTSPVIDSCAHLNGRDPADFQAGVKLWGHVRGFDREMVAIDLDAASRGLSDRDAMQVREAIASIREWLTRVELAIGGSDAL